jgi:hypothetical protein
MLVLSLAVLTAIVLATRNRKLQWRLAGACAALLLTIGLSSCGVNQRQAWTTPAGAYSVTVIANAGGATGNYIVTLNVNK